MKNKDITKYILKANKNLSIEDLKLFVRSLKKANTIYFIELCTKRQGTYRQYKIRANKL